jgi:hypothetical protein
VVKFRFLGMGRKRSRKPHFRFIPGPSGVSPHCKNGLGLRERRGRVRGLCRMCRKNGMCGSRSVGKISRCDQQGGVGARKKYSYYIVVVSDIANGPFPRPIGQANADEINRVLAAEAGGVDCVGIPPRASRDLPRRAFHGLALGKPWVGSRGVVSSNSLWKL